MGFIFAFSRKLTHDIMIKFHQAATECEDLYTELNKIENELSQMEEAPDKKLHYDKYFYINKEKDGSFGYIRNHKAIDEALALCGFFVIGETDFQKTTAEILELYRRRDVVEKHLTI